MSQPLISGSDCDIDTLLAGSKQLGLFALLDGACSVDISRKAASLRERELSVCLYRAKTGFSFSQDAPYLVSVDENLLCWLKAKLGKSNWGVLVQSGESLQSLARHLRRFLLVETPDGERCLLRYYDPRVLPSLLSSFDPDDCAEFFGPVHAFICMGQSLRAQRFINSCPPGPRPKRPVGQLFRLRSPHVSMMRRTAMVNALRRSFEASGRTVQANASNTELFVEQAPDRVLTIQTDGNGYLAGIISPLGRRWTMDIDTSGRMNSLQNPAGSRLQLTHNEGGDLAAAAVDDQHLWDVEYDDCHRPVQIRHADGSKTEIAYLYAGAEASKDPAGRFVKDLKKRNGNVERYSYTQDSLLKSIIDGNGNKTNVSYSVWNRPDRITYADKSFEEYNYNQFGTLSTIRQPDGTRLSLQYSQAGLLTQISGSDGLDELFEYTDRGLICRAQNAIQEIGFAYDKEERIVIEKTNNGVVEYFYDAAGNLVILTLPSGRNIEYSYDQDGRVVQVRDTNGEICSINYDSERNYSVNFGGKIITSTSASELCGKIEVFEPVRHVSLCRQSFQYDSLGRLKRKSDSRTGDWSYQYDPEGQILSAHCEQHPEDNEEFAYDGAGNSVSIGGQTAVYNNLNQITRVGTSEVFEYDSRGNLISKMTARGVHWQYYYNSRNQLVCAYSSDGDTVLAFYDALGRRCAKAHQCLKNRFASSITFYTWAGEQIIQEEIHKLSGKSLIEYTYWPSTFVPLAMRVDGRSFFICTDHLGAPQVIYDENSNVAWSAQYTVFGAAHIRRELIKNRLRLPGHIEDEELGLHYNRFRYYSPRLGRYISRDPLGHAAGLNLYLYCENNPLAAGDPLGLWWKTALSIVGGIAVGAIVVLTAPASVPAALVILAAGALGGAVGYGLNELLNQAVFCLTCILKAMAKGFLVGLLAAVPFVFLPATAGILAFMGVGAISGGISYTADWALSGADPDKWNWNDFAKSVGIGAVTAGLGRWILPKITPYLRTQQRGPYSNLEDPPNVGPGKDFTAKQKQVIYEENMRRNGGELRCDETGQPLVRPQKSVKGVTPPNNEAQIDHITPKSPADPDVPPGTNSYSNARVVSREVNQAKSNSVPPPKPIGNPGPYVGPATHTPAEDPGEHPGQ